MMKKAPGQTRSVIDCLESRYSIKIVARFRSYRVVGNLPWWKAIGIQLLLLGSHFVIYFWPFVVTLVLGWAFGVFK